jgi:hypothetical protein
VERRRIGLLGARRGTPGSECSGNCPHAAKSRPWSGEPQQMLAVADRFEADLPVAEMDVTSTADLTRLLEPSKS